LDGFWQHGLKPWDVAAGALLAEEAAGKVTTLEGAPHQIEERSILASNGLVHTELRGFLYRSLGEHSCPTERDAALRVARKYEDS
jgi:3'-phosphoadenosine 5'-phosphosulfate (PAPS) 3'-phosphatase